MQPDEGAATSSTQRDARQIKIESHGVRCKGEPEGDEDDSEDEEDAEEEEAVEVCPTAIHGNASA